jgi:hypothetical protein
VTVPVLILSCFLIEDGSLIVQDVQVLDMKDEIMRLGRSTLVKVKVKGLVTLVVEVSKNETREKSMLNHVT